MTPLPVIAATLAESASSSGGISWGTLALVLGGGLLLALVSSIGILARMRDRRVELAKNARRASASAAARPAAEGPAAAAGGDQEDARPGDSGPI